MKKIEKVDLSKIKSKVKKRPQYYCKCGLSKRLPYCDGGHECGSPADNEPDNSNGGCEDKLD